MVNVIALADFHFCNLKRSLDMFMFDFDTQKTIGGLCRAVKGEELDIVLVEMMHDISDNTGFMFGVNNKYSLLGWLRDQNIPYIIAYSTIDFHYMESRVRESGATHYVSGNTDLMEQKRLYEEVWRVAALKYYMDLEF